MPENLQENLIGSLSRGGGAQYFYYKKGTQRPPAIFRAEGIYIWDTKGNQYIDASSGPVAVNIGHGNERVISAMTEQARKATFAFPFMFESEPNLEFSNELMKHLPAGLDRALIVSGGSEAVEACMKFARTYAMRTGQGQRHKFISRNPSYHGATLGAQSLTGDDAMSELYEPITKEAYKIPAPLSYRFPEGETPEGYAKQCANLLETEILKQGPETVLAFVMEPIAGLSCGADYAPASYYRRVREICTKYGILLIYDEVLTGLGRSGKFIASDHWPDARPDLMSLSKGLGAGYMPIGALIAPASMVECVSESGGFPYAQTYTSTPLACATSLAVLREIIDNDLVGNSERMGILLRQQLNEMKSEIPIIGDVRGKGLLSAMEFVADQGTKKMLPLELNANLRINQIAMENGLVFYPRRTNGGRFGDWLMVSPPLIISEEQIMDLCEKFRRTLRKATDEFAAAGYLK